MTVFDSHLYRDPMQVLEAKQNAAERKAKQCGDCVHKVSVTFKGETANRCTQKWQIYGRRCDHYEQKQNLKPKGDL
jgi:hypothetical protein